jgi:hypothetical protein
LARLAGDEVARLVVADGFPDFDAFCTHWRGDKRFKLNKAARAVYLNLIHWGGR